MTWINTTWSQQAATVTPSSPAVVLASGAPRATPPQASQEVEVPSTVPSAAQQAAAKQAASQLQPSSTIEAMKFAAQQIENYLRSTGRALDFRIDDASGRTVVTVRDSATGETIRQIPSEEVLRLAQTLGNQPSALIDLAV